MKYSRLIGALKKMNSSVDDHLLEISAIIRTFYDEHAVPISSAAPTPLMIFNNRYQELLDFCKDPTAWKKIFPAFYFLEFYGEQDLRKIFWIPSESPAKNKLQRYQDRLVQVWRSLHQELDVAGFKYLFDSQWKRYTILVTEKPVR